MKKTILVAAILAAATAFAQGQHWVQPHYDKNGNFIQGHMQTNPDGNPYNNWSTQGNVNPYTGQLGMVNPYQQQFQQPTFPIYQQPRQRQCGYNAYGQYVCR